MNKRTYFNTYALILFFIFLTIVLNDKLYSQTQKKSSKDQNLFQSVVMLKTDSEDFGEVEVGSGIVIGQEEDQVFVVTAFHVIQNNPSVKVKFYEASWREYPAEVFQKFSEELDLAVLVVTVPSQDNLKFPSIRLGALFALEEGQEVHCVGNPFGNEWRLNKENNILNPNFSSSRMSISPQFITSGYSGGIVVDKKRNMFLGMILEVGSIEAIVIKSNDVLLTLSQWKIPTNLVLPFRHPTPVLSFALTGLSAGALAGGIIFNSQGKQMFDNYQKFPVATANIYNDTSFDQYYQDAEKKYTYRNLAYSAAGALLISAIGVNFLNRKKKNAELIGQSQMLPIPTFTLSSQGNMSMGVVLNF